MEIDSQNAKAYFRLAQAYDAADNLSLARANFVKAAQLSPNDKLIRNEIDRMDKKIEEEKANKPKDQLFSGMFNKK